MARDFRRKERLGALSEINMTPLIDLAFSLLIIFMISAPLLEQTIAVDLPAEAAKPQGEESPARQDISLDGEGQIFWGELRVSEEELAGLLESLAAEGDPPVIHLRADAELAYGRVVRVIDLIKRNQLTRLSLDTRVE